MASVRVTVTGALSGGVLLPETAFDRDDLSQQVRRSLGDRPSRPVTLLHGDAVVDGSFVAPAEGALHLSAVLGQGLSAEERARLLQRLREAPYCQGREAFFAKLPEPVRDDAEFVMAAVELNPYLLIVASKQCKAEPKIWLEAVRGSGWILRSLPRDILEGPSGREIVFAAVQQDPHALQFAGSWRDDRALVSPAVLQEPQCLRFAGDACRDHRDIALEAVRRDVRCHEWVGTALLQEKESFFWKQPFAGEGLCADLFFQVMARMLWEPQAVGVDRPLV